jgi:hypothetical protein
MPPDNRWKERVARFYRRLVREGSPPNAATYRAAAKEASDAS